MLLVPTELLWTSLLKKREPLWTVQYLKKKNRSGQRSKLLECDTLENVFMGEHAAFPRENKFMVPQFHYRCERWSTVLPFARRKMTGHVAVQFLVP